eukprot:Colp12_sorted_trinity150504_noHs@31062
MRFQIYKFSLINSVQFLDLSRCKLTSVPLGVFQLLSTDAAIIKVDLSHNILKAAPKKLANYTSVAELTACHNVLQDLPYEFGSMKNLQVLNISFNRFTRLPDAIYELENLRHIIATDNAIEEVEIQRLASLAKLKRLELDRNRLSVATRSELMHLHANVSIEGNVE